jgi:hypothetical protein
MTKKQGRSLKRGAAESATRVSLQAEDFCKPKTFGAKNGNLVRYGHHPKTPASKKNLKCSHDSPPSAA